MKANFEKAVVKAIKSMKGCQFIELEYVSEPSLNKSQKQAVCLLGGSEEVQPIIKVACGQFQANYSYQKAVNNRGEKEQGEPIDFVAAPLRWGQWVEGQENKLIEHKGNLYFRFYGLKNGKVESKYYIGGNVATAAQEDFIKKCTERGEVKSQAGAGLTENQVIARDVKISNIVAITINGIRYELREEEQREMRMAV